MAVLEMQGIEPDIVVGHGSSHPGSSLSVALCGHKQNSFLSVTLCSTK